MRGAPTAAAGRGLGFARRLLAPRRRLSGEGIVVLPLDCIWRGQLPQHVDSSPYSVRDRGRHHLNQRLTLPRLVAQWREDLPRLRVGARLFHRPQLRAVVV